MGEIIRGPKREEREFQVPCLLLIPSRRDSNLNLLSDAVNSSNLGLLSAAANRSNLGLL